jgi:hypothetical protein
MKFLRSHARQQAPIAITLPTTRPRPATRGQRAERTHYTLAPHHLSGLPESLCLAMVYHNNEWMWGLRATAHIPIDDPIIGSSEYAGTRADGPVTEDRLFRPVDAAYVMTTVHPNPALFA